MNKFIFASIYSFGLFLGIPLCIKIFGTDLYELIDRTGFAILTIFVFLICEHIFNKR